MFFHFCDKNLTINNLFGKLMKKYRYFCVKTEDLTIFLSFENFCCNFFFLNFSSSFFLSQKCLSEKFFCFKINKNERIKEGKFSISWNWENGELSHHFTVKIPKFSRRQDWIGEVFFFFFVLKMDFSKNRTLRKKWLSSDSNQSKSGSWERVVKREMTSLPSCC